MSLAPAERQHIRAFYFPNETEDSKVSYNQHLKRLQELALDQGFILYQGLDQEHHLEWDNQQTDYHYFDVIMQRIWDTVRLTDEEYRQQELPRLMRAVKSLSRRNFILARLDDHEIQVSKAHQGKTPFVHTQDVAAEIMTSGLTDEGIVVARMEALMHDLGKLMIASGDVAQYHAYFSYLIFKDYVEAVTKRGGLHQVAEQNTLESLSPLELEAQVKARQEALLLPIRYHHLFQLTDMGIITVEEARELVPSQLAQGVLAILSTADAASVEGYLEYSLRGGTDWLQLVEIEGEESEIVFISHFVTWLGELMNKFDELSEAAAEKIAHFLHMISDFFAKHSFEFRQKVLAKLPYKPDDEMYLKISAALRGSTKPFAQLI